MTKDEAITLHKATFDAVYAEGYYTRIFDSVVRQEFYRGIRESENLTLICDFWNQFWFDLPDTPAIRGDLFFKICDLSEGSYVDH